MEKKTFCKKHIRVFYHLLEDIDMNIMLDVLSFNSKTVYQIYLFYFIHDIEM
jgi:hypothetical protein